MEFIYFNDLIGKTISVDQYFHTLIKLGWKYDLEESDLFIALSKTFWEDGIKVSMVLAEFCCVAPNNETSSIHDIIFYSFDTTQYPKRSIYTIFNEEENDKENSEWESIDEYIKYFNEQYPFYIPYADFNTGIGHNDFHLLKKIDLRDVPIPILNNVKNEFEQLV